MAPSNRPAAAARTIKAFDFEERAFNAEAVPRFWFRAQHAPPERERAGFPQWNRGAFDYTIAKSGKASVKLPLGGGSCALRLAATQLPILPDADLRIEAQVTTRGMLHARAGLLTRLLDQTGAPLAGTDSYSELVTSESGWALISSDQRATPPEAAFLQIELLALQPDQRPSSTSTDPHIVSVQDLSAAAYFDDVTVRQLPRLTLRATGGMLAPATGQVELKIDVRDQAGEKLTLDLMVTDIDGRIVHQHTHAMPIGGEQITMSVTLPRAGWYLAQVGVTGGTAGTATISTALLRPPQQATIFSQRTLDPSVPSFEPDQTGPARLMMLAEDLPPSDASEVLRLTKAAALSGVSLSATPLLGEPSGSGPMHNLTDALISSGQRVTLAFNTLPGMLLAALSQRELDPLGLADIDSAAWFPILEPVLDRFGRRIVGWRFGQLTYEPGASPPDAALLSERSGKISATLRSHALGSQLLAPWRAEWQTLPEAKLGRVTVIAGGGTPSSVAQSVINAAGSEMLVLQTAGASFSERDRAIDAAQRLVYAWLGASALKSTAAASNAAPVFIAFDSAISARDGRISPEPQAAILLGLAQQLLGRSIVATLADEPGHAVFLLDPALRASSLTSPSAPPKPSALIAWSEQPGRVLERHLGAGPLFAFDMLGNPVDLAKPDATGLWSIPLSEVPIIIEGVDAGLVRFVAGLSLDPSFIPAAATVQETRLSITNPWPGGIIGTVQLTATETDRARGWAIGPASAVSFALTPGETTTLPFALTIPPSEIVGPKVLTAIVRTEGDRTYGPFRIALPIRIGVPGLDLAVIISPSGNDLIASITATNSGSRPRTLLVEIAASGRRRQDQSISRLQPGESATRRFILENAAALTADRLWVSATDVDTAERLNTIAPLR